MISAKTAYRIASDFNDNWQERHLEAIEKLIQKTSENGGFECSYPLSNSCASAEISKILEKLGFSIRQEWDGPMHIQWRKEER